MSDQHTKPAQAFLFAVMIEALVVLGALALLTQAQTLKPAISEPVPITLTDVPEPEPQRPPEPKKIVQPQIQPKQKTLAKVTPPAPVAEPVVAATVTPAPAEAPATPNAFSAPAPAVSAAPPTPSTGKSDVHLAYAGRVNAAVQLAHTQNYPAAATASHFSGQTQVEFHLRDGVLVDAPRVLASCGNGMFDRSAVSAVQSARYPAPPEDLRGRDLLYKVWVEFISR